MKRIILLVIDGLGIGEMQDVEKIRKEDLGANTLKNVILSKRDLQIPTLLSLGIMNALGEEVLHLKKSSEVLYGVSNLKHIGADSLWGHYEIAGYKLPKPVIAPFISFKKKIMDLLKKEGYKVKLGHNNKYITINDSIIIGDNLEGEEGQLYSVIGSSYKCDFQEVLKVGTLLRENLQVSRVVNVLCEISLEELENHVEVKGEYTGVNASKCNMYNRGYRVKHLGYPIFSEDSLINILKKNTKNPKQYITLIGKVADMIKDDEVRNFPYVTNVEVMEELINSLKLQNEGLIFANAQDTDLAGHLENAEFYGEKLEIVDKYLEKVLGLMDEEDLLIITGDHGNDPTIGHKKHTREKTPILLFTKNESFHKGFIGERKTLGDIGCTITNLLAKKDTESGECFLNF